MSIWQAFKNFVVSDKGDVINRVGDNHFVSADGTTYTQIGNNVIGTDGSQFIQVGGAIGDGMGGRAGSRSMMGGLDAQPATWIRTDATDADFGMRSGFADDNDDDKW